MGIRVAFTVAYDGTGFAGWQRQKSDRTAEGCLLEVCRSLDPEVCAWSSGGRTDAGVHAAGQVVSATFPSWTHGSGALQRAAASRLPEDLSVLSVREVSDTFDARRSAIRREYRYLIVTSREAVPQLRRHAWRRDSALPLPLLSRATDALLGTHDFRAFGSPMTKGGPTIRKVDGITWSEREIPFGEATVVLTTCEIAANAFLRGMARTIVGAAVAVAEGRAAADRLSDMISFPQELGLRSFSAPPQGLTLWRILYA